MKALRRSPGQWLRAGLVAGALLAALALASGPAAPDGSLPLVLLDLSVGLAFALGAAYSPGPVIERAIMLSVGLSWLVGSVVPAFGPIHQGFLAVGLVAFPSGKLRGPLRLTVVAAGVLAGLRFLPQPGVIALFVAVASTTALGRRWGRGWTAYPTIAASGVAAAVALSWAGHRFDLGGFDPTFALVAYQVVLLAIAATFPAAAGAVGRARARLADEVLAEPGPGGLEGVAVALREVLGDRSLEVYRWDPARSSFVGERGEEIAEGRDGLRWMVVDDATGSVGAVASASRWLEDAPTASAVASAVRLTVTNLRLREELDRRVAELEASRFRILAAADRTRDRAALELREGVQTALEIARRELESVAVDDPAAAAALDLAARELEVTRRTISDLVFGVPPAELGRGRLRDALADVLGRTPVPVRLTVADDVASSAEVEAMLYYVVSEAVANAVKHAEASAIVVRIERRGGAIVATTRDDGRGGADPSGPGLQGLADRLATAGGRLRVEGSPGAGTTVTATVPA